MIRPILKMGAQSLMLPSQSVTAFNTPALAELLRDMEDTMIAADGAGLAAPQIGVNLQVVIFGSKELNPRYPDAPIIPRTVLINPVLTPLDDLKEEGWEGCKSVPRLHAKSTASMRAWCSMKSIICTACFTRCGSPICVS